jgi:hypothetical protein
MLSLFSAEQCHCKEITVFIIAELFHQIHRAVTVRLVYKNSTKKIKGEEILSCLTISVP